MPRDSPVRPAAGGRAAATGWMRRHKITTGLGVFFLIGALGSALPANPPAPVKITAAAELHETPSPTATQAATPAPAVTMPVQTVMPASSPTPSQAVAQHVVLLHGVAGPDRHLTPGSLLSGSTLARICTSGYTRTVRNVSAATRRSVFQAYCIALPECRIRLGPWVLAARHGDVSASWLLESGSLVVDVTVPDGVTATVRRPRGTTTVVVGGMHRSAR